MFWEEKFTDEENFTLGEFTAANLYSDVMMNMNILSVVTPTSIYYG